MSSDALKLHFISSRDTLIQTTPYFRSKTNSMAGKLVRCTDLSENDHLFFKQQEEYVKEAPLTPKQRDALAGSIDRLRTYDDDELFLTSLSIMAVTFGEKYREYQYGVGTGIAKHH